MENDITLSTLPTQFSGMLRQSTTLAQPRMVFCYQNCSDLLWEKIVLVIEKKFEAEGREFSKFLRAFEQFIQTVKGQNNFW